MSGPEVVGVDPSVRLVLFNMRFELVATVRQVASSLDDKVHCPVFLMRDDLDLVGRTLQHRRFIDGVENTIGILTVEGVEKRSFALRRLDARLPDGSNDIVAGDALYVQLEDLPVVKKEVVLVKGFLFNGKNWKLASSKKWEARRFEKPRSRPVDEVRLAGRMCDVYQTDNGWAAIPVEPLADDALEEAVPEE